MKIALFVLSILALSVGALIGTPAPDAVHSGSLIYSIAPSGSPLPIKGDGLHPVLPTKVAFDTCGCCYLPPCCYPCCPKNSHNQCPVDMPEQPPTTQAKIVVHSPVQVDQQWEKWKSLVLARKHYLIPGD